MSSTNADKTTIRYVLQRSDRTYFRHPTNENLAEWTADLQEAHRWVSFEGAQAAQTVWESLKGEAVTVIPVSLHQLELRELLS